MLFQTTDDRIKKLEKRLDEMARRMNKTLASIDESFTTITEVITKLQKENERLKKERDAIIESQKQLSKGTIREAGMKNGIKNSIISPVKKAVAENFDLIREVAKDDILEKPDMAELLKLVQKQGEMSMQSAAERLKVHELQVEHWANILKEQKFVSVLERKGKKYMSYEKQVKPR